jgi:hypothetical protein
MPNRSSLAPPQQSAADFVLAHPLDEFYAMAGLALPPLVPVDGEAVPEPYRRLLVHQDDMTPTLEKFYRRRLHLHVLGRRRKDDSYYREVTLLLDGTDQPVEFGAIRINLALFDPVAREEILKEKLPLGAILREKVIAHSSRPRAFIRLATDPFINDVLKLSGAQMLFGRRNSLLDPRGRPLAEIVEILPTA